MTPLAELYPGDAYVDWTCLDLGLSLSTFPKDRDQVTRFLIQLGYIPVDREPSIVEFKDNRQPCLLSFRGGCVREFYDLAYCSAPAIARIDEGRGNEFVWHRHITIPLVGVLAPQYCGSLCELLFLETTG